MKTLNHRTPFPAPPLLGSLVLLLCALPVGGRAQEVSREGPAEPAAVSREEVRSVARRFAGAFEDEDWDRAVELGKRLVELSPDHHVHPYNLACAYARRGDPEAALGWLRRAAEEGFSDPELLEGDEDLASLRPREGFGAALEAVRANAARARTLFREMARDSRPVVLAPAGEGPHGVLVLLHGFGDTSPRFAAFFEDLGRTEGLLLVAPRSVIPTAGGGFEWGTAADTRWLVERALEEVREHHAVDARRIYLLGFSQGGRMAYEIGLGLPERFAGVIAVGAGPGGKALDLARRRSSGAPPFFLMAGAEEPAGAAARQGAKALRKAGVEVRYRIYPGVGHHFPPAWPGQIRKALSFFAASRSDTLGSRP